MINLPWYLLSIDSIFDPWKGNQYLQSVAEPEKSLRFASESVLRDTKIMNQGVWYTNFYIRNYWNFEVSSKLTNLRFQNFIKVLSLVHIWWFSYQENLRENKFGDENLALNLFSATRPPLSFRHHVCLFWKIREILWFKVE